jgi:hypothetical protein
MAQGLKLHEIDAMDMPFYMRLRAHEMKQQKAKKTVYIDQLGIF